MSAPHLLLIDGHSLAFRAYYAFSKGRDGGLRTSTGIPTSVCFGFLKSLLEILEQQQSDHVAIAFDLGEPTFRHAADENYKAGRAETPQDFITDIANLQALLRALRLPLLSQPGYEADDVIGTVAHCWRSQGWPVSIVSGDRDLFQLIDREGQVQVLYLGSTLGQRKQGLEAFDALKVKETMGVWPEQIVDYKALCGDASDRIPGIKGIGPKTAVQLLSQYPTLEDIYAHIHEIRPPSLRTKLINGEADARHSRTLAQIVHDVPLELPLEELHLSPFDWPTLDHLLDQLEFRALRLQLQDWHLRLGGILPDLETDSEETWFFAPTDTPPPLNVQLIETPEQLQWLMSQLETCTDANHPVAWDTETTALNPRDAALVGLGCCWGAAPDQVAYLPLGHKEGQNLPLEETLAALRPILEGDRYPKVLQNAKFDRLVLRFQGIQLRGVVFDTMLASYVINPEASHNLKDLCQRYLPLQAQSYRTLVGKDQTLADLSPATVAQYCGLDVHTTYLLKEKLEADLTPRLRQLLLEVELPLEPILAEMEATGIRIDSDYLRQLSQELEQQLAALQQQAWDAVGQPFNLASPKQLSELLFGTLGLDTKKTHKTKLGYSTDAATLEKLRGDHPVIDLILSHRTLAKLKSTYVDVLPTLVRPDTGRVHTEFNQAVTATGRLSSSSPNLQNIPIRTEFSRQIRRAFIPEAGWLLVAADYSQIELRILAHLSQEPALLAAYQEGADVHRLTAQFLLEKTDISSSERRLGKMINFGVIYGMGPQRFAREAGVSVAEAKVFIQRFYNRYPRVFDYLRQMERLALSQGYVETILGRRRYFAFESRELQSLRGKPLDVLADVDPSKLKMSNYERGLLRAAANAPIQGSSADIIKCAMVKLAPLLPPEKARLLLQVHDELVLEMTPEAWEHLQTTIPEVMSTAVPLSVPLAVDIYAAANWLEAN
ncbi:DNA polymerase I [Thermosynechococcus vestitus]|uniref:DNA polymerase I n=1 Tax=Thermosynechococcus vestitus (strain NIES-2133 / IAM M-273 / BP-1) TaxID=197221 RepID=Q8DJ89_THEVB|nr:DNA polymerase I [Thermosynechococcus vestitus]BAC08891.1 DNA polymerase I [Thermosynechococcus vestitus BP-1]